MRENFNLISEILLLTILSKWVITPVRIRTNHCVKSVQIRSYFWSLFSCIRLNTGKYGPEITPYLDAFHAGNAFCGTLKNNFVKAFWSISWKAVFVETVGNEFQHRFLPGSVPNESVRHKETATAGIIGKIVTTGIIDLVRMQNFSKN